MKKIGGKRNYGYGRTLKFAIRNLFRDKFGDGNHSTRRSHVARLGRFEAFLKESGVKDLRQISVEDLENYASLIGEECELGELSVSYGNNLISSGNVLVELLTNGTARTVSPSEFAGRRSYVRTTAPSGFDESEYRTAIEGLIGAGEIRLALMVGICRLAGARFREASLLPLRPARQSANDSREIVISMGTKGGCGRKFPRRIEVPELLVNLLNSPETNREWATVIPENMNYIQWYSLAHREWRRYSAMFGLSSKFHDFRAAYACERFERLTGLPAPCLNRPAPTFGDELVSDQLSDQEARIVIAKNLGHGRVDVLNSYIARST